MRYRKLDMNGDYSFGHGKQDFFIDNPAAVAQAIKTRLKLFQGEWFYDTTAGTPWNTQVLGTGTLGLYDSAIKSVITKTQGVVALVSYNSTLDRLKRVLTISATVQTQFSATQTVSLTTSVPLGYGVGPYGTQPFGQ